MLPYRTFRSLHAHAEFTEKKSVFITDAFRIDTEEDAKAHITDLKKHYPDATHHCYAYIIRGTEIARFQDDGEPSGTAGMPILEVLKRENVTGVLVIVTRYFGGILLGAGGLSRAYAKGAKMGLDEAGVAEFVPHIVFDAVVDYSDFEIIKRDENKNRVHILSVDYAERVTAHFSAEKAYADAFEKYLSELTNGKCHTVKIGERYGEKA